MCSNGTLTGARVRFGVVAHVICCGCFSSVRQPQGLDPGVEITAAGRRHGGNPGNAHPYWFHPRPYGCLALWAGGGSLAVACWRQQKPACASNARPARCSRCRGCCCCGNPARGRLWRLPDLRRDSLTADSLKPPPSAHPEGIEVCVYRGLAKLPPFNQDSRRARSQQDRLRELCEQVAAGQGLFIATPNTHSVRGAQMRSIGCPARYQGRCWSVSRGVVGASGGRWARVLRSRSAPGAVRDGVAGRAGPALYLAQMDAPFDSSGRLADEAAPARWADPQAWRRSCAPGPDSVLEHFLQIVRPRDKRP